MNTDLNPTERFSDRADNYAKYRPSYPPEVLKFFRQRLGLKASHAIADIGSGTGISTELFLKNGNTVYAIEPNQAMRQAAEMALDYYLGFHSKNGTAEATGLAIKSVDFIVACQAFHWFKPEPTKKEFRRILKPGGHVVLIWNDRKTTGSGFSAGYEALLNEFGTDYATVKHRNMAAQELEGFLGEHKTEHIYNCQDLDFDSLMGRLASSSYAPNPDHPRYPAMCEALKELFKANAVNGHVKMEYDTQIFHAHWK